MDLNKVKPTEAMVTEEVTYTVNAAFTFRDSDLRDPEVRRFYEVLVASIPTEDDEEETAGTM